MQITELYFNNGSEMFRCQRMEDNHVIYTIDEFRPELLRNDFHYFGLHRVIVLLAAELLDALATEVRRHDNDRIAKIHGPPVAVGQPSVVEHLQQDVEDIRVRLLDLVQQHHRIRSAPYRFRQMTAFLIAHVAGRRTNQSRDRMLLHELGHVHTNHRVLGIEQKGRQRLRDVRQDDARGELFLSLYGEVQKEVVAQTLASDYGLDIEYRPTTPVCIERPERRGTFTEQIPRRRRPDQPFLATVGLNVEPLPVGSGVVIEFALDVKQIPIHVFDSVDAFREVVRRSVLDTLDEGLKGWSVTDCKVTMMDCDYQAPPRKWPGTTLSDYRDLIPLVLMAALKRCRTTVCEPVLAFRLEVPNTVLGAMMSLLATLEAVPHRPGTDGSVCVLEGTIRAARLHDLQSRVPDLTQGEGVLESTFSGYQPVVGTPPSRPRTDRNPVDRVDYLRRLRSD